MLQGYGALSPNSGAGSGPPPPPVPTTDSVTSLGLSGPPLPPMSSFRGPSGGQSPASILYPSHSPVVQTPGDTLGKALASVSSQKIKIKVWQWSNWKQWFGKKEKWTVLLTYFKSNKLIRKTTKRHKIIKYSYKMYKVKNIFYMLYTL